MINFDGSLGKAALFVLISAALHVVAAILSGFAPEGLRLLPFAVLYVLLALGLMRGMRLVAWLTFLMMLIGSIGALAMAVSSVTVPAWAAWGIVGAEVVAAVILFLALWRPRPSADAGM